MRPQPSTARPWQRWLLVVLTLAGLGVWQGGHCAAHLSTTHTAGADGRIAAAPHGHPAAGDEIHTAGGGHTDAAPAHEHGDRRTGSREHTPDSTAGDCETGPFTAAAAAATTVLAAPAGTRGTPPSPACAPLPAQPPPTGVTLTRIGVSRT
jgi:hypothetical protein